MRLNLGSSKATFKVIEIKNVNERNGKFSWDFFKKDLRIIETSVKVLWPKMTLKFLTEFKWSNVFF